MQAQNYLSLQKQAMTKMWPDNPMTNIVCHGHSVPAGYFTTPTINGPASYPHKLYLALCKTYSTAVLNVIVTAIGGENSEGGAARFEQTVLCHQPDVLLIDYSLNDRGIGLERARTAWKAMIEAALAKGIPVILLTPSWDETYYTKDESWQALVAHTEQVRELAKEYSVGLADSFAAFERSVNAGTPLSELLSQVNHPSEKGHELIVKEILPYFM